MQRFFVRDVRDWLRIFLLPLAACCVVLLASCGSEQKKPVSPPPQAVGPAAAAPVAAKEQESQAAPAKDHKDLKKGKDKDKDKTLAAPQTASSPQKPAPAAKPQVDPTAAAVAEAEKSARASEAESKPTQADVPSAKPEDSLPEQKAQPAPIDETNQEVAPSDPNAKAKLEAEVKNVKSDLPLMVNEYVAGYIDYFSNRGRGVFERALVRSGRYREMIERIFAEEGVPQDLIYLAQAESGFYPRALSRAGARGMWQFIGARASGYGLERSWWVDDRQDPEKATRAAARHLKDLYAQFGDWYLAMAAYNSGPGNVQLAVKRTGYADFWELYRRNVLPKETKNYVPIILAMTIMSKNPARYGLDSVTQDTPDDFDVVKVSYPVDLRLVAECVDVPVERLAELNPSLLRHITPRNHAFDLRLPTGSKEKYETAIAAIPTDKRMQWRLYQVHSGDTLYSVAHKFKTTERTLAQANNLEGNTLPAEAKLVIPLSGPAPIEGKIIYAKRPTRYQVRRGDTVISVADEFGVPPDRVRRWNGLKTNKLARGRWLTIYKPLAPGEPNPAPVARRKKKPTSAKANPAVVKVQQTKSPSSSKSQ